MIRSVGVSTTRDPLGVLGKAERPLVTGNACDSSPENLRALDNPMDYRTPSPSEMEENPRIAEIMALLDEGASPGSSLYGDPDDWDDIPADMRSRSDSITSSIRRDMWDRADGLVRTGESPVKTSRSKQKLFIPKEVSNCVEKLFTVALDSRVHPRVNYPRSWKAEKFSLLEVRPMEYFREMGNPHLPLLARAELLSMRESLSLIRETRNEALTRIRSGLSCRLQHKTLRSAYSISLKGTRPLLWRKILYTYTRASLKLLRYAHWDLSRFGLDQADLRYFNEVPRNLPHRGWFRNKN